MFLVKTLLILGLMVCGAFFLAVGLGASIPHLEYHGLMVRDMPIGCVFILAGLGIARWWNISRTQTTEETTTDGVLTKIVKKTSVVNYIIKP
jgi:hypothetical protein